MSDGHQGKIDVPEADFDKLATPPSALAVITTIDVAGRVNAAASATCLRNSHAPTCFEFTTSPRSDTAANVLETGEFVVNIACFDRDLLERVRIVGLPFPRGVDELEKAGLSAISSRRLRPPRILECKSHFECRVEWTKEWLGSRLTVVGRVVAASVDRDCIDENGYVIFRVLKPTLHCGRAYGGKFVAAYEIMDVGMTYDANDLAGTSSRPSDGGMELAVSKTSP